MSETYVGLLEIIRPLDLICSVSVIVKSGSSRDANWGHTSFHKSPALNDANTKNTDRPFYSSTAGGVLLLSAYSTKDLF